ncbi:hypothetical protein CO701_10490 [Citrobacter werkmanii]|nr:hypothetical protein CO701_10490 [Citrobacter werkmanii]
MYSVNQLVISGCKRQWILMDTETSMPLLYPLSLFKVPPWPFLSTGNQFFDGFVHSPLYPIWRAFACTKYSFSLLKLE